MSRSSPARSSGALVSLCFFVSGFAALIYQTAWTRQFAFVFGTSELAVATVLAGDRAALLYGARDGYHPLRQVVADKTNRMETLQITADDVIITTGASQAVAKGTCPATASIQDKLSGMRTTWFCPHLRYSP